MDNHTDSVNKAGSGDSADVYNKVYELAVNRFRQLADDLAPKVGSIPLIREPYWEIAKWYYRRRNMDVDRYRAPIDPFKIVWVDPAQITRMTGHPCPWENARENFGAVKGGDWDQRAPPSLLQGHPDCATWYLYRAKVFTQSTRHQSFAAHFRNDVPWLDTEFIRKVLWIVDHDHVWKCDSKREIRERCAYFDALCTTIEMKGYRSQRELIVNGAQEWPGLLGLLTDEILVDVGRDGELLFVDGRHRLSVAKILDLDAVPVAFQLRHPGWMEHRERVYESGGQGAHPDLQELTPSFA